MLGKKKPYSKTGTTTPIYIARDSSSQPIRPGEYFWIKIAHAQAAFYGSIFEQTRQLLVTSKVNLNHPVLGDEEIFALQRSRAVRRQRAEQLGLSPNLISLVPTTMDHVSVTIDYMLDVKNHLATIGGLINDDSFLSTISLAPGAVAVAKTVSGLAQKVIQSFVPAEERRPILQFAGDFNISPDANDLRDGYYVILGSRDEANPLPVDLPKLEIIDNTLRANGQAVTQLSYVVLDVRGIPVRTRNLGADSAWEAKFREAEGIADDVADDPFADDAEKKQAWEKIKLLIREARALIINDPTYAPDETKNICKTVYKACADKITGTDEMVKGISIETDTQTDRALLDIGVEEDLEEVSAIYKAKSAEAEKILQEEGVNA